MQPTNSAEGWRHSHHFNEGDPLAERNTRWVVVLTALMMVAEIVGGWLYNSMALLADGWHMSSHALALSLSVLAYGAARRLTSKSATPHNQTARGRSRCWEATPARFFLLVWPG